MSKDAGRASDGLAGWSGLGGKPLNHRWGTYATAEEKYGCVSQVSKLMQQVTWKQDYDLHV
jgi:hypothetical protein